MRIAVLGGAFDPPTKGHTQIAQILIDRLGFDEVWIIPVYQHIFHKNMSDFEHRMSMCLIAFEHPQTYVSYYEQENHHVDGTLSLYKKLRKTYRENFYMVIGMDNANLIDKWINAEELINTVPFVVISRKGVKMNEHITWYINDEKHIFVKDCDIMEISSTMVRDAIKNNNQKILKEGLNPNVLKYIKDYKLYK